MTDNFTKRYSTGFELNNVVRWQVPPLRLQPTHATSNGLWKIVGVSLSSEPWNSPSCLLVTHRGIGRLDLRRRDWSSVGPYFIFVFRYVGEGGCDHGRSVPQLFRAVSAGFRGRGAVLRHHRDPRHPGENRRVTPSSPPGRDPRGRLGEPIHAACAVALSLDLGNDVPP